MKSENGFFIFGRQSYVLRLRIITRIDIILYSSFIIQKFKKKKEKKKLTFT